MALEIPKLLVLATLACATMSTTLTGCDSGSGGTTSPAAGGNSPAAGGNYADLGITLTGVDDEDFTIVSKTEGDVHVLAFWATWCIPCVGELGQMKGVYDKLKPRGLNVYAISIDGPDTMSRVPGYIQQQSWDFPVLYDPDTRVLARYNPKGDIPFYVVLDADGNILKSHQGYVKGDMTELEQFLDGRLPAAQ